MARNWFRPPAPLPHPRSREKTFVESLISNSNHNRCNVSGEFVGSASVVPEEDLSRTLQWFNSTEHLFRSLHLTRVDSRRSINKTRTSLITHEKVCDCLGKSEMGRKKCTKRSLFALRNINYSFVCGEPHSTRLHMVIPPHRGIWVMRSSASTSQTASRV